MFAVFLALFAGLTVHVEQTVENLTLVIVDGSGSIIQEVPAPEAGTYVFELSDGTYSVRAMVDDRIVGSIPGIAVPAVDSVDITLDPEALGAADNTAEVTGARRNQNIQVNLVDNQALNEALGRQGAQVSPVTEFSAARGNFAAELGGIGRDPQVIRADRRGVLHGEVYETHNNHTLNARTFFQVGQVQASRRNQYGFRLGGPLGSDKLSFVLTGEETRESGFVNDNVLVPLLSERTALAEDPEIRALVQSWLDVFPAEGPNRPGIAANLLNTNATQKIRSSGGSVRVDWEPGDTRRVSARYSLNDNFIDSFELVVGQNPNQRLRPQTLNLAWEESPTSTTSVRLGANYIRAKIDLLVPPGSVGPYVNFGRDFEALGPQWNIPVDRITNTFQYLAQGTTIGRSHRLDWGIDVVRTQINELEAEGQRGVMSFGNNFGRSSIDNFRHGTPSRYSVTEGDLYRGFRRWDINVYLNDRIAVTGDVDLTLGLRYEYAGAPSEVNGRTTFDYDSDANNFAPRIGLAWSRGSTVIRAGYGISYGEVFPASFRTARLNPPDIVRADVRFAAPGEDIGGPNILDPLKGSEPVRGVVPRSGLNLLDADLATPYSHQYTLGLERELPAGFRMTLVYSGSRMMKLFRIVRENRAERVEGIPLTTSTINDRRADQRFFSIARMTNRGRAFFDAGQLRIDKAFSQGLSLRASYTFSKALDIGSDFSNTGVGRDERRAQIEEFADSDLKESSRHDAPHAFTLAYSWELPRWLGGVTVSGTTILKDGTPFSVETGTDSPARVIDGHRVGGNVDGERSDRPSLLDLSLLGASIDNPDTALTILRRDAFDGAAGFDEGRGNLSRNAFRKDGTTNFNVSISRTFRLGPDQTRTLTLRTELINAFNHPQFDGPNSNLSSPTFGQITNTVNAGRIIQFYLRLNF